MNPFEKVNYTDVAEKVANGMLFIENKARRGDRRVAPQNLYKDIVREFRLHIGSYADLVFSSLMGLPGELGEAYNSPYFWKNNVNSKMVLLQQAIADLVMGDDEAMEKWLSESIDNSKYRNILYHIASEFEPLYDELYETRSWRNLLRFWEETERMELDSSERFASLTQPISTMPDYGAPMKTASGMPEELQIAMRQLTGSSNPTGMLTRMVGAKNFMFSEKDMFVQFNHMPGRSKHSPKAVGKTRLHYDIGRDTYTLTFLTSQGNVIKEVDNIHNDQLMDIWEDYTGLYLTFQSRRATTTGAPMKRARFEEGKPADPTIHMTPEDAKIWDEMNEKYGDMLKTARGPVRWKAAPSGRGFLYDTGMEVWNVRRDRMGDWYVAVLEEDGTIWTSQDKYDNPDDAKAEAERRINAPFNEYAGMRKTATANSNPEMMKIVKKIEDNVTAHAQGAIDFKTLAKRNRECWDRLAEMGESENAAAHMSSVKPKKARFEEGKPADPTIHMTPEDAKIWDEMNEKYGDMLKSAGRIVSREPYLRALERMSDAYQRSGGSHQKLYDAVSRRIEATKDPGKLLGIIDAIENDVLVGSFGTVPPHIEKLYTDLVKRVEVKHGGRRVAAGNFSAFINSGEAVRAVASVFRGATVDDGDGAITWENVTRKSGLQLIYRGGFYENGDVAFTLVLQQRQEIIELLNTTVSLSREKEFVQVLGGLHLALQKWKDGIANLAASL